MKKSFNKRRAAKRLESKNSRRTRLKSACLSLGLATAWGGDADAAQVPVRLSISPEHTLMNAHVLYGNNFSSGDYRSLGTILGGQTSVFLHHTNDSFESDPPSFSIIGIYEDGGSSGITLSFPNDDVIANMSSWSTLFSPNPFTEEDVKDDLEMSLGTGAAHNHVLVYGHPLYAGGSIIAVDFDTTGTLVNFSDPTFGGTVSATVVPEASSFVLLVSAAGVLLLAGRRRGRYADR